MIYRFRVTFEDNEEVYREIDIKSAQHFEDFHNIIMESISFDNIHNASFFISDDYWRKGEEIVLKAVSEDDKRRSDVVKRQMRKCKLAALIDDPHQKFVYIYDPNIAWTFLIELLKIVPDDPKVTYPKCTKTVGIAPKQYNKDNVVPVVVEDEDEEHEPESDTEAYVLAHSEDETALLESEEGEEVVAEEEVSEESEEFGEGEFEAPGEFEED